MDGNKIAEAYGQVPEKLKRLPGWMACGGEDGKTPLDQKGRPASRTVADNWSAFGDAVAQAGEHGGGLGWVIQPGYVVLDIDDAFDEDGEVRSRYREVCKADTYMERSVSGTGLHIAIRSDVRPEGQNEKAKAPDGSALEVQGPGWFVRLTGEKLDDKPSEVHFGHNIVTQVLQAIRRVNGTNCAAESGPGTAVPEDDNLVKLIQKSDQAEKFNRLMAGDTTGYPSGSEADMALAGILVFWTGGDPEQMERIMRRSALGILDPDREQKWARRDYLPNTIAKMIKKHAAKGGDYYGHKPDADVSRPGKLALGFTAPRPEPPLYDRGC